MGVAAARGRPRLHRNGTVYVTFERLACCSYFLLAFGCVIYEGHGAGSSGLHRAIWFPCLNPSSGHGELWDVLVDDTPPTVDRRMAWSRQILGALAELERSTIIHRDLNPWNLFLSSEQPRAVKLGDFGAVMSTLPRLDHLYACRFCPCVVLVGRCDNVVDMFMGSSRALGVAEREPQ